MVTDAEVYAMVVSLGDVGAALKEANPDSLERLYQALRLEIMSEPLIFDSLRVWLAGVSEGGVAHLSTRLLLSAS